MRTKNSEAGPDRHETVGKLLQELAHEWVLAGDQVMQGTIEDEAAFCEHQEGRGWISLAFGQWHHAVFGRIEVMCAHGEWVLETMRYEDRRSPVKIALFN